MLKRFLAICAAAVLLLTGCSAGSTPSFEFSGNSSGSSSSDSSHGSSGGSSGESKSGNSKPDNSSESSSESFSGSSGESSNEPSGEPAPSDLPQGNSLKVCYDPINDCTLEFDGDTVIFSGSSEIIESVFCEKNADVEFERDGNDFVYKVKCKNFTGYFNFLLTDGNHSYDIRLKKDKNGVSFPDVSEVKQYNELVAANPVSTAPNITAKYITRNGKIDKAGEVLKKIKEISDGICKGLSSDYDKLRAISRWVSDNIYYDHPAYRKGIPDECLSLEYMLDKHSSVCGGYSNMTSALCAAQGIRCLNINGKAITGRYCYAENQNGEHHEWNYAIIDGRGIWVDSGWNSYNGLYDGGRYSHGDIGYFYFDIGSDIFALDHAASSAQYRDYFCKELYSE